MSLPNLFPKSQLKHRQPKSSYLSSTCHPDLPSTCHPERGALIAPSRRTFCFAFVMLRVLRGFPFDPRTTIHDPRVTTHESRTTLPNLAPCPEFSLLHPCALPPRSPTLIMEQSTRRPQRTPFLFRALSQPGVRQPPQPVRRTMHD